MKDAGNTFFICQFKGDDALWLSFHAETTSKILVLASDGKVYTLDGAKLPGGRGYGDPIRLMVEIGEGVEISSVFLYEADKKMLICSYQARGFIVPTNDLIANKKTGRQVLVVEDKDKALLAVPVTGDHIATIGENRKLVIFPLDQVPEMGRGRGVTLPHSTKPKPKPSMASGTSAFLSKPAARPIGF